MRFRLFITFTMLPSKIQVVAAGLADRKASRGMLGGNHRHRWRWKRLVIKLGESKYGDGSHGETAGKEISLGHLILTKHRVVFH